MKKHVVVTQVMTVELDESKFTPEFQRDFSASIFEVDGLDEHVAHLAQLGARGVIEGTLPGEFVEGYGRLDEMGIRVSPVRGGTDTAILNNGYPGEQ